MTNTRKTHAIRDPGTEGEPRAYQEQLEWSNERLEKEISQRKDAEERLKEKVLQLELVNRELEQILDVVTHDLQEPLRLVSSYLQLVDQRYKGKLNGDADDFISFAVGGAKRMRRLINDLVAFSRVPTRVRPRQPCNCDVLLDKVISSLNPPGRGEHAAITRDTLPTITADKRQLAQVFRNLIGNAMKFRRQENVSRIHVSARRADKEWIFSIKDNGIGIDPEYTDRIFVIFRRPHGSTEYPGTGAGLAITKRIVEHHGGRIWAESEPGKGSTFYFTIPTEQQEEVTKHV
ncbi:MAG: ATP-binding protein [Candidatus Eisenbacteria bacterium]